MQVIRYETPKNDLKRLPRPIIFLAGPTVRGNQPHLTSWRFAAIEEFQKQGYQGSLILPEFTDKTQSDKGRDDLPVWEDEGLNISDVIMFWIPRTKELIGLTTNQEFGYWMAREREKVIYGRPDDAYRISYQDIMWKLDSTKSGCFFDCSIYNTLEDTIRASIELSILKMLDHDENFL